MNVLFVGGPEHGKIKSFANGKIPMEKCVVPYDPDDRACVFTGPSAIVNQFKPADTFTYENFTYVLRRVRDSDDANERLAYVYFASEIKPEHVDVYLEEPFILQKLRKIGVSGPKKLRQGPARVMRFAINAEMERFLKQFGAEAFALKYGYLRGMNFKGILFSDEKGHEAVFEHENFGLVPEYAEIPLDTNYTPPS